MRKNSPPPGFDPRAVQPVANRYSDWATWPTFVPLNYTKKISCHCLHCLCSELYVHSCHECLKWRRIKWEWHATLIEVTRNLWKIIFHKKKKKQWKKPTGKKLSIDEKATLQSVVRIEIGRGGAWAGVMWLRIGTSGELMWICQLALRFRNKLGIYFVHLHRLVQCDIVQRKWLLFATFEVLSAAFLRFHVFWNMKFCRWVCGSRGSRVKLCKKN